MQFAQLLEQAQRLPGMTTDSREVVPGGVFISGGGKEAEQSIFLASALERGAAVVVSEHPAPPDCPAQWVGVPDFRAASAMLACARFQHPARSMLMIGITGTCGKTTSTFMMESVLAAAGHKVGLIGTVTFRYPGVELPATHTTPGPLELQALLATMRDAGCTAVVMEVSSHAIKQHRTLGIAFDGVIFTNLSHEHLDLHKTMEDYFETKALLFTDYMDAARAQGKKPVMAIHTGDAYGKQLSQRVFDREGAQAGFSVSERSISITPTGISGPLQEGHFSSPLVGRFNAENLLGVVTLAERLGVASTAIASGLARLALVPGRLERIENDRGAYIFVDYAHKPGALEVVLATLKETLQSVPNHGKLCVLFGCGGDRDRAKRPTMGEVAARIAECVWVTSDNPRTEAPEAIIAEIMAGVPDSMRASVRVVVERREAIVDAVQALSAGDLLLVAGRGHETDQVVGLDGHPGKTMKIHFDDREEVRAALRR